MTRGTPWFLPLAGGVVLAAVLVADGLRSRPDDLPVEGCVECHEPVALGPSHPVEFGCSSCHLGDPLYLDEERAHRGMVVRPSELAVVARTCGQVDCHPDQVERVTSSLMATNAGIGAVLAFQFGEASGPDGEDAGPVAGGIPALLGTEPTGSLAEDHFRKFCATCHLHKSLGDLPGEIGTRGGGCADCHLQMPSTAAALPPVGESGWAGDGGPDTHPRLTTAIPTAECVKCHNRSARIGLSYQGMFEDEGYGTPYHRGGPTRRSLSGGRSWQPLLPDVHHESGMACIDCHLGAGVMGDGEAHLHMEEQVAIACEDCHEPRWSDPLPAEAEEGTFAGDALRSGRVSGHYEVGEGAVVGVAASGQPVPHLQQIRIADRAVLLGRLDGEAREVPLASDEPYHSLPGHERLSCQACHSAWTPQCYGCHEVLYRDELQRDHVAGRDTPGRWEERRSFLRFERPTLGVGPEGTVQPFAPGCQVFLTEVEDGQSRFVHDGNFPALAMAAFDPHTTRTDVPSCIACHLDPKVLGLGDGALSIAGQVAGVTPGVARVASMWDASRSRLGLEHALDAFVDGDGRPLQTTSRVGARPFEAEELRAVLAVSACLPCHDRWDDPVWLDWDGSVRRWRTEADLPCRRAVR